MEKRKFLIKTQLNNLFQRQDIIEASSNAEACDIGKKMAENFSEDGWVVTNMCIKAI